MAALLACTSLPSPLVPREVTSCSLSKITRLESNSYSPSVHHALSKTTATAACKFHLSIRGEFMAPPSSSSCSRWHGSPPETSEFSRASRCRRHGARIKARELPRAASNRKTLKASLRRNFASPSLSIEPQQSDELAANKALYLLRLSTSRDARSTLSQPGAGVQVALIGETGRYALYRAGPYQESLSESSTEGEGKGADTSDRVGKKADQIARFQRGSVDSLEFVGEDVGPIAALWIAPEAGTWRLSEATVTAFPFPGEMPAGDARGEEGRTGGSEEASAAGGTAGVRYVFRSSDEPLLGEKGDCPAAEMLPLRVESADLADGRFAAAGGASTDDFAKARAASMEEYQSLKQRLVVTITLLGVAGSAIAAHVGGTEAASSFAIGSLAGLLYLLWLQYTVDSIPSPAPRSRKEEEGRTENGGEKAPGLSSGSGNAPVGSGWLSGRLSARATRLGVVVLGAIVVLQVVQEANAEGIAPVQLLVGFLGFFTYKAAILLVSLGSLMFEE